MTKGLPAGEILGLVDFMSVQDVASSHAQSTNAVINVLRIFIHKVVHGNAFQGNGRRHMQPPEQKRVSLLNYIV